MVKNGLHSHSHVLFLVGAYHVRSASKNYFYTEGSSYI